MALIKTWISAEDLMVGDRYHDDFEQARIFVEQVEIRDTLGVKTVVVNKKHYLAGDARVYLHTAQGGFDRYSLTTTEIIARAV